MIHVIHHPTTELHRMREEQRQEYNKNDVIVIRYHDNDNIHNHQQTKEPWPAASQQQTTTVEMATELSRPDITLCHKSFLIYFLNDSCHSNSTSNPLPTPCTSPEPSLMFDRPQVLFALRDWTFKCTPI